MSMLSSAVKGFISGGVTGALKGAIPRSLAGGGGTPTLPAGTTGPFGGGMNPGISIGGPYGFNIGFGQFGAGAQPKPTGGSTCPRGYHLNKHALASSKRHGAVAARSICVRNRSMNAMNPRAITRSLKRIKRATKIVRRLHAFQPVRHAAAGGKFRRRK